MTCLAREKKIRFTLLFDTLENVHLHKDVGQIPFQLQKHFGYDTEIICHKARGGYGYIDGELKGLKLRFITTSPLLYLLLNAKKIDVLMLFHVKSASLYATILYKLLNPKGLVYVKYDLPDCELLYATWGNRNVITQLKRTILFRMFVRKLDLFSVECRRVYDKLTKIPASKKIHMPNGFDPDTAAYYGVVPKPFEEKENIILLVGRHGTRQKNSELLLQALEKMGGIGDWQIFFVGPMTEEFKRLKDAFIEEHPCYRGKIHFPGNIDDKKTLFDYYNRSKIFCFPSRWESWGLVCGEALCFGNVLVMSREIVSGDDLTDSGRTGFLLKGDEPEEWANTLTMLMSDEGMLREYYQYAREHFARNFIWKDILGKLVGKINQKLEKRCG